MARLNAPLTRSTLLDTQRSLARAREGYELLDRKREVLIAEIMNMVDDAEAAQRDLAEELARAYRELAQARITMGVDQVRRASLSVLHEAEVKITERSIMGAVVPMVDLAPSPERPKYSFTGTTAELDEAAQAFSRLLNTAVEAAEIETTVWRLAGEIRKTQRRVNALHNVVIPNFEKIVKAVQEALAEEERESFYRAKMVKKILERNGDRT